MKETLQVDGRELSLEEVEAIVREHFSKKEATEQKTITQKEGVPFVVDPSGIDRSIFQKKRKDSRQETTRQLILEAFAKMDINPERYGKPYKTLMPAKTWDWKTVDAFRELATKMGDHMADWVEQALEWAQRIQNGETWKAICNEPDTANWYRLIEWKNGLARLVGGSRKNSNGSPASDVGSNDYFVHDKIYDSVPLVVLYK